MKDNRTLDDLDEDEYENLATNDPNRLDQISDNTIEFYDEIMFPNGHDDEYDWA